MNEAVRLAVEKGGYCHHQFWRDRNPPNCMNCGSLNESPVLDPLFWQALGKVLGWGTEMWHEDDGKTYWDYYAHCPVDGEIVVGDRDECPNDCETENPPIISWLYHAHQYFDLVLTGSSPEKFWFELLTSSNGSENN